MEPQPRDRLPENKPLLQKKGKEHVLEQQIATLRKPKTKKKIEVLPIPSRPKRVLIWGQDHIICMDTESPPIPSRPRGVLVSGRAHSIAWKKTPN